MDEEEEEEPEPEEPEPEVLCVVDKIVDQGWEEKGSVLVPIYKVHWDGYAASDDTWRTDVPPDLADDWEISKRWQSREEHVAKQAKKVLKRKVKRGRGRPKNV